MKFQVIPGFPGFLGPVATLVMLEINVSDEPI